MRDKTDMPMPAPDELWFQLLRLHARCDALSVLVTFLAHRDGADAARTRDLLEKVSAQSLQDRLEKLEAHDPAAAARIDRRVDPPDLDPDLMDIFRP